MALLPSTITALTRLIEACGLKGQTIRKLVISCEVNEPVRLYVAGYIDQEQLGKVSDAIELLQCRDVEVQGDGTIEVDKPVVVKPYCGREFI